MAAPRFQFTIRRLIVVIAICAVCSALLRTPFALLVVFSGVGLGVVLPGFLWERTRGGSGILGGALAASVIASGSIIIAVAIFQPGGNHLSVLEFLSKLGSLLILGAGFAFVLGLIFSSTLYLVLAAPSVISRNPLTDESCDPIRLLPLEQDPR